MTTDRSRLFFALWPPAPTKAALLEIARHVDRGKGRTVAADNLHLTLLFLGAVDGSEIEHLQADAADIVAPAFTLRIERSGWWRRSNILWLAPAATPSPLLFLVKQLRQVAASRALPVEKRPYHPHVTLVRKVRQMPTLPEFEPVEWPVKDFCLVQSITYDTGPHYRILQRWPLKKKD